MKSEYLDKFDAYFSGTLNETEKEDLESRLNTDVKVADAFKEYKDLRRGIDYSIMKSLKEELQELEGTLPDVVLEPEVIQMLDKVKTKDQYRWWKAAAMIVLVAVSATVLLLQQQTSSPQEIFSQHFEPFENQYAFAKRGDDIAADPIVQAFMAYDAADYSAAIVGFQEILGQEEYREQHSMVLFYLGSAQLAQGQSDAAIATLEGFLQISQDNVTEARWYLALSYMNENRVDDARGLLEGLRDSENYGKEAGKILKKLD